MIELTYILLTTAVLLFVIRPFFAPGGRIRELSRRERQRRSMLEDRERVYTAIQELDFDYRMGKVEEADYRQTRARYEQYAITLLKALDKSSSRTETIARRIEAEVSALRKKRSSRTCPDCDATLPADARFCPGCGVSVSRS